MIYKALHTITGKFDQYLSNKFNLEEKMTVLSTPACSDGISEGQTTNRLIISLVNIERDTTMGINFKTWSSQNDRHFTGRPSLSLNLYALVSSNFSDKNYDESLKYLSSALEMVQAGYLLTSYNTPELSPEILKLHLEPENIGFHELSNIWSMLGGKYLPSFLLKVRMLAIDKTEVESMQRQTGEVRLQL